MFNLLYKGQSFSNKEIVKSNQLFIKFNQFRYFKGEIDVFFLKKLEK
jgi:hypothetical protein